MSLTKLGPSGWRYFAEEIATGREDYFARSAEHPGRYLGRGAEAIGLAGTEVDALGLERLIGHGTDPRDGATMGRGFSPDNDNVVAGFGLTFSVRRRASRCCGEPAAKSSAQPSLPRTNALLRARSISCRTTPPSRDAAQAGSSRSTPRALSPRASSTALRVPRTRSFIPTSLSPNKVRAEDGRWLSLDGRELYEHQKAAGMLYRAALRAELTASLRVSWMPVDENGIAEIQGVPEVLVEAWSTRRHEVESLGAELVASREAELGRELSGGERARCLQLAAYRSRAPKLDAETPTEVLVARWREEAASFGQAPERWLPQVLGQRADIDPRRSQGGCTPRDRPPRGDARHLGTLGRHRGAHHACHRGERRRAPRPCRGGSPTRYSVTIGSARSRRRCRPSRPMRSVAATA